MCKKNMQYANFMHMHIAYFAYAYMQYAYAFWIVAYIHMQYAYALKISISANRRSHYIFVFRKG